MITIEQTDIGIKVEWPDSTVHIWHYKKDADQDWHKLINHIADIIPWEYGPVSCSTGADKGAGGLQYGLEGGIVAFCDKYGVSIMYCKGMWECSGSEYSFASYKELKDLLYMIEKVLQK